MRLQLHRVAELGDRESMIRTGSTRDLTISFRNFSLPEMRKNASAQSFSDSGSPSVQIVCSTGTAPACTAAACESGNESRLQAHLPHVTCVVRSCERISPKMSESVDLRSTSIFRPLLLAADSMQKTLAHTRIVISSSRRDSDDAACTSPSFPRSSNRDSRICAPNEAGSRQRTTQPNALTRANRILTSGMSRLRSAFAQTCLDE